MSDDVNSEVMDTSMEDRVFRSLGMKEAPKQAPKSAPAPQAPVEEPAQSAAPEETPAALEAPAEPADTSIEIEFEGATYKVPPELKKLQDGYLRQEDYTRKTQEAAEMRKVADLTLQQAQAQRALQEVTRPYVETLIGLNNQIKAYQGVDWNQLSNQDATEANRHWIAYQSLKDRKGQLEGEMQGAAAQHLQKLHETADRLKTENSKILSEKVKGWNTERDQKVREFAKKSYGFSDQELSQVFDARILRMMNDAHEWQSLQAAKPAIQKQAAQASKTLKPSAAQQQSTEKTRQADLRKAVRTAKTDESKARAIQSLLEHRL